MFKNRIRMGSEPKHCWLFFNHWSCPLFLQLESGDVQDGSLNGGNPAAFFIHITADLQLKEFSCAVQMETTVAWSQICAYYILYITYVNSPGAADSH